MTTNPLTCPHCAANHAALFTDPDGVACLLCGWHAYSQRPTPAFAEAGHYSHELRRWLGADGEELAA